MTLFDVQTGARSGAVLLWATFLCGVRVTPAALLTKYKYTLFQTQMLGVRSDKKVSRSLFLYLYARVKINILNYSRAYLDKNI